MKGKSPGKVERHEGKATRYSNVVVVERSGFDEFQRLLEEREEKRVGRVSSETLDLEDRASRVRKMLDSIEEADASRFYESDMRDCQREADAVNDESSEMEFLEVTRRVMLFGSSDFAEAFLVYGKCLRRFVRAPTDFPAHGGSTFASAAARQQRLIDNIVWSAGAARHAKHPRARLAISTITAINTAELMRAIVLGSMHQGLAGTDPPSYKALKRFLSLRWAWKVKAGLFEVRNAIVHGDARFADSHVRLQIGSRQIRLTSQDLLRYSNAASIAWSAVWLHLLFSRAWARTGNPWFSPYGRIALHAPRAWKRLFPQWVS